MARAAGREQSIELQGIVSLFVLGAGIGFVAGVTPGPVLTLVVAETFRGGWSRGAAVAIGPILGDGPIIVAGLLFVGQLPPLVVSGLSVVGGAFLIYLAITTFINSRRVQLPRGAAAKSRRGLLQGWLARILTPNAYLFWFLIGAPVLVQAGQRDWLSGPAFLLGYYSTIVGSNVVLAIALQRWVRYFSERVYRTVLTIASILLAGYGAALAGRGAAAER